MKAKIKFYTAQCRRGCGQSLTTTTQSIYGMSELKKKYNLICKNCITDEEMQDILNQQAQFLSTKFSNGAMNG